MYYITTIQLMETRGIKRRRSEENPIINNLNLLHTDGYVILKNSFEITDKVMTDITLQIDKKARIIFNHNLTNKKNDKKRLQCNLQTNNNYTNQFINNIIDNIQNSINNNYLIPSKFVVLMSLPNCQAQAPHTDYEVDEQFIKTMNYAVENNKNMIPLLALISIEPNTYLYLWKKSINLITKTDDNFNNITPINSTKIKLNKGDIVLFRADLVHAGSDYDKENIRLHVYLDSPLVNRKPNRTFLIHKHAKSQLRDIIR